ncbi:ATP-binding protein [Telluribacter sp. SYSU D00476]|uniref:sensor histidine kinase n=1 Tax=Telluribacter sp. SYSU D00476 TaxID=2811430 RepID=UPI001FF3CB40|nr:ATP-binding protein [Telluribacter sp. SYSU D00476]
MDQLDRQVARRLTRFYVVALLMVALLTISGLLLVRRTLEDLNDDGRVVNVAGRQRMLSQQLTKLSLLRTQQMTHADVANFDSVLHTWHQNHEQLRNGLLRMEKTYVVRKSEVLDSMFVQLEPVFQSIYSGFRVISSPQASVQDRAEALRVVLAQEPAFLRQMDQIVFQFDAESLARVQYLERMEWLLGLGTLLILLVEGMFIFRPVVKYTQKVIQMLTRSEEDLRQTNERLAATNRELVATQEELLRMTEEKYQLQAAREKIRSAALLEGQEEERRRFARELHDGIGQMLTGVKLHAEKLKQVPFPEEKQRKRFEDLRELIQETIQTTRQVSFNLMPSVLSDFGLEAGLQLLSDQVASSSGIQIHFEGSGEDKRLPPATEIGLYRIVQEALHNAVKHARAKVIEVKLKRNRGKITLCIEDDGKGFDPGEAGKNGRESQMGSGIENMRTRASLLGGEMKLSSRPGKGTKILVVI